VKHSSSVTVPSKPVSCFGTIRNSLSAFVSHDFGFCCDGTLVGWVAGGSVRNSATVFLHRCSVRFLKNLVVHYHSCMTPEGYLFYFQYSDSPTRILATTYRYGSCYPPYSLVRLFLCFKTGSVINAQIKIYIFNNYFSKCLKISFLVNVVSTLEKIYLDSPDFFMPNVYLYCISF
jgi:hypothetical protein